MTEQAQLSGADKSYQAALSTRAFELRRLQARLTLLMPIGRKGESIPVNTALELLYEYMSIYTRAKEVKTGRRHKLQPLRSVISRIWRSGALHDYDAATALT